jgi:hypothetical protein
MAENAQTLPRIFKWFGEGKFAASGFPETEEQLCAVAEQGIKHIVAASNKAPDADAIERLGMTVDRFSGVSSDIATLDAAIESLHAAAMRDDKALIH